MKVIHDALTRDFSCMFIRLFIYLCNSFTSGRCTRVIFTSVGVVACGRSLHGRISSRGVDIRREAH
jgi:hypothetical protein